MRCKWKCGSQPKKESSEDAAKWTNKQWTTENSREEKLSYEVQWCVLSVQKFDTLKETVKIGLNSEKKTHEKLDNDTVKRSVRVGMFSRYETLTEFQKRVVV